MPAALLIVNFISKISDLDFNLSGDGESFIWSTLTIETWQNVKKHK